MSESKIPTFVQRASAKLPAEPYEIPASSGFLLEQCPDRDAVFFFVGQRMAEFFRHVGLIESFSHIREALPCVAIHELRVCSAGSAPSCSMQSQII